jgi:membrane protein implicated in regulation of membrane protease activity
MTFLFLAAFIAGLLLGVRVMFFGAERRRLRPADAMPLRRSEPAIVAFLMMFGVAGYLLTRHGAVSGAAGVAIATLLGLAFAVLATRLAVATARVQPEHDPDDPRYVLQGHVAQVSAPIPADGEGKITFSEAGADRTIRARTIDGTAIAEGQEVCIERVEDEVAFVELWAIVEQRL